MMSDPHNVIVPQQAVDRMIEWLSAVAPKTLSSAPRSGGLRRSAPMPAGADTKVTERLLQSDGDARPFGIVTHPLGALATTRLVFLLNAGSVHHVGPSRLYVELARDWARQGITVVRFDLPGIGDSDPHPGAPANMPYPPTAVTDIGRFVGDVQAEAGAGRPFVLGLCSGAYHALKSALEAQAAAVVLINPLTFYYSSDQSLDYPEHRVLDDVNRYRRSVLQVHAWRKLFTGRVDVSHLTTVLRRRLGSQLDGQWRELARALGLKLAQDLGSDLNAIAKRGTQLHFVFSRGDPGLELLRIQAGAVVGRLMRSNRLSVSVIDGADHTFTARAPRTMLQRLLTQVVLSDPSAPVH